MGAASRQHIVEAFEGVYRRLYGRVADGVPLEVVNWRVTVSGPVPSLDLRPIESRRRRGRRLKGHRRVYFAQYGDYRETPVYDRYRLGPGDAHRRTGHHRGARIDGRSRPRRSRDVDELSNVMVRLLA